jgi:hypothetical protein
MWKEIRARGGGIGMEIWSVMGIGMAIGLGALEDGR